LFKIYSANKTFFRSVHGEKYVSGPKQGFPVLNTLLKRYIKGMGHDMGSICMIRNGANLAPAPVSWSRSRGAEIKLPPGSASFLFSRDLKKFYRKIMVV
jgi:hypothetical protein